jgi:hypothetical protein
MAKGAIITEKVFSSIIILHEANPELNNKQISAVFKVDESTVGKMIRCGTWENYEAFKKEKAEKQQQREKAKKTEDQTAEEQEVGQIEMDLRSTKAVINPEMLPYEFDQTKLMRFQAAQVDKLIVKIDRLNDTMSMILRAVRKE